MSMFLAKIFIWVAKQMIFSMFALVGEERGAKLLKEAIPYDDNEEDDEESFDLRTTLSKMSPEKRNQVANDTIKSFDRTVDVMRNKAALVVQLVEELNEEEAKDRAHG